MRNSSRRSTNIWWPRPSIHDGRARGTIGALPPRLYHFYVAVDGTARAVGAATQSLGMNKFAGDCPAFIVVAEQPYNRSAAVGAKLKDQDYRAADIGLAVSQLVYRAHELGLSTCILGWFDEKTLQALLNTNARVRLIIAIGYARADDALRTKKRKSLEELVTWL